MELNYFAKIGTLFEIEFGINNLGPAKELDVIRIALDGEMDLKEHFSAKLSASSDKDVFYLLNKTFWQKWLSYVGLPKKDSFNMASMEKSANAQGRDSERARRPVNIMND